MDYNINPVAELITSADPLAITTNEEIGNIYV